MKQKTFNDILTALSDEPKPIGDRLEQLGLDRGDFDNKFSKDLLSQPVYGSSFVKFLQDNATALAQIDQGIPAKELPADYKNPFDDEERTVGQRLDELGISKKELKGLFAEDTLGLNLNGEEFGDFIIQNQDKFLGRLKNLALKGAKHA